MCLRKRVANNNNFDFCLQNLPGLLAEMAKEFSETEGLWMVCMFTFTLLNFLSRRAYVYGAKWCS